MKDRNDKDIKKGMIVICEEPIKGFLEKGKKYQVLDVLPESGRIVINPDARGKEGHYKSTRFVISD